MHKIFLNKVNSGFIQNIWNVYMQARAYIREYKLIYVQYK